MERKYWITIDGGTTNTRIALWDHTQKLTALYQAEIGVRVTAIEGTPDTLKRTVKNGLEQVCASAGITWDNVERIAASGMITSNMGLVEIQHISAPAGIQQLRDAARTILLPDVCPLPITFIPGVKSGLQHVNLENFDNMDMMRGEEVEAIGMLHHLEVGKPYLLILPGSHTKMVSVNSAGQIVGSITTITGELLQAITYNTLIADAVDKQFVSEEDYDKKYLYIGYHTAKKVGISRASFLARTLNIFVEQDKKKLANYLLGAVLQNDIHALQGNRMILPHAKTSAVIAGKAPLRRALYDLLTAENLFTSVQEFVPDPNMPLASEGIFLIIK